MHPNVAKQLFSYVNTTPQEKRVQYALLVCGVVLKKLRTKAIELFGNSKYNTVAVILQAFLKTFSLLQIAFVCDIIQL